jgi:hypothetical protein
LALEKVRRRLGRLDYFHILRGMANDNDTNLAEGKGAELLISISVW